MAYKRSGAVVPTMARVRIMLVAMALLAGGLAVTATTTPSGVSFDHAGGNEWWVEVEVEPKPEAVDAMDTAGAWVPLEFKSWGEWAASFRIEPGHDVRFRARYADAVVESCWFSHPAGEPRCDAPEGDPAPPVPEGARRVVALGDTASGANARANAAGAVAANATAWLGLGDYDYDGDLDAWEDALAPLLALEHHLVIGNHEHRADFSRYMPNGTTWSVSLGGARVVGLDSMRSMAPGSAQHAIVRSALCDAPEPLRILTMHHPWWLGEAARHPGDEFPATAADMDALVAGCGVDVVLAAHEHNYQRLMRGEVAYLIVGTGGRSLYPVAGSPTGTAFAVSTYGHLLLDVDADGVVGHFRTLNERTLDTFEVPANATVPPPPPSPSTSFTHGGGNEWWVEVKVSPQPARVLAMDTGGSWLALSWRSWGEWAGSFRIEPGHEVRFLAEHADGTSAQSCWFSHPTGVARCGEDEDPPEPPPSGDFSATFHNVRGNEWWVETDVRASGGTLAGVDARVDGGAWVALEKKSWGSWAKSIKAPEGSSVEFRARASDGQSATSSVYRWPPD